jgi:hypothetical protein
MPDRGREPEDFVSRPTLRTATTSIGRDARRNLRGPGGGATFPPPRQAVVSRLIVAERVADDTKPPTGGQPALTHGIPSDG